MINHVESMYHWHDLIKTILYLFSLPFTNLWPQSNQESNIRQFAVERHLTQYMDGNFQNYQTYQKQGKSEKLSEPGRA